PASAKACRPPPTPMTMLGPNPSSAPSNTRCSKADASTTTATPAPKSSNTSTATTTLAANTPRSDIKPPSNSKLKSTHKTKQQLGPIIGCTSECKVDCAACKGLCAVCRETWETE